MTLPPSPPKLGVHSDVRLHSLKWRFRSWIGKNKSDSKLWLRIILFIYFPRGLWKIIYFVRDYKKIIHSYLVELFETFWLNCFINLIQRCRLRMVQANSLESDLWYRETLKYKWRLHITEWFTMESWRVWFQWNVLLNHMWLMHRVRNYRRKWRISERRIRYAWSRWSYHTARVHIQIDCLNRIVICRPAAREWYPWSSSQLRSRGASVRDVAVVIG